MGRFSLFRLPSKLRRRVRRTRLATLIIVVTILLLLVLPLYVIYKPPAALIHYFQRKWPDVLWQVTTDKKIVALTIDDAPSQYTDEIRELLRANDAKATFFIIGSQIAGREGMLLDIVSAGMELGNHVMHDEPSVSLTDDLLRHELSQVSKKIRAAYKTTGVDPPSNYFRPGSGFFSARMRRLVDRLGYRLVLGSIYPHDAQIGNWHVNANHILSMLRPGAIIICHDRRSWTLPMLRKVLPEIKRRGYKIVTVTELLKAVEA
jgi:peptidoglycan/xylan/chitin deacetylase (PgdA/CDA1 family)